MSYEQVNIVYVLSNEAMPGLVKIGKTSQGPEQRLRNLYTTSVPFPFKCEYACYTSRPDELEGALHKLLENVRVNPSREFFRIAPENLLPLLTLLNEKDNEGAKQEIDQELGRDENSEDVAAEEFYKQTRKLEESKRNRRPNFGFKEMQIPEGSEIVMSYGDQDYIATVCGVRKVKYNDALYSLSDLSQKLAQWNTRRSPLPYWRYQDRCLQDIYDETYPFTDD